MYGHRVGIGFGTVKNISVNSLVSLRGFLFGLIIREIAYGTSFTDSTAPPDCSVQPPVLERNLKLFPRGHGSGWHLRRCEQSGSPVAGTTAGRGLASWVVFLAPLPLYKVFPLSPHL